MLEFLTKIVKEAYLEIKDIKKEVSLKGEKDYVTNCDIIVEKYIIEKLKENYPNVEIISEEFNYDKETCEKYFTIDPIDGTINFASGLDIWGTQVAYVENGKAIASVIYFPKLDLLVQSNKNNGAYINGNVATVKDFKQLKTSLIALDTKNSKLKYKLCEELNESIGRIRLFGAPCYGFGMVANGSLDGYCFMHNTPWDIEPGLLACVEAGAKYYRDDFCTIVANSDEIIKVILDSLKKVAIN